MQLIWPVKLEPTAHARTSSTADAFTAVAGWDCPTTRSSGFNAVGRQASWYTAPDGGWAGDGCHGTYELIPMSGQATADDPNQLAVWWFTPTGAARCAIQVYVPARGVDGHDRSTSAQFYVLAGRAGAPYAQFVVDQSSRPGTWVPVGTFPANSGGLAVQLVDRGVPRSPSAMLAVAQIKLTCTG
jgi:translation initiation factor IF-2